MRAFIISITILLLASCETPQHQKETTKVQVLVADPADDGKIMSFLGEELQLVPIKPEIRKVYEENLQKSEQNLRDYPDSLDLIIWHGRRLAYLGRHFEAIEVFTNGLTKYPLSYRLRRHRGHRYITTRQISKAVDDFELAAFHSTNAINSIEPDGLPNKLNKPLGNDFFNIWYHFGLAHYLNGRYDKAISAYINCMKVSDNDDLLTATSYWLYMSYKKIGNPELAEELLKPITSKMKMVENDAYLNLLLLFKGENEAKKLLAKATNDDGMLDPTLGYGIGNWYQQQGNNDKANEIFLQIMEGSNWQPFGFIAAEKELTSAFPVP